MLERDNPVVIAGGVLAVVAAAAVAWTLLRPDPDGLREVVTVDAAGDTLVYSGPVRDAIARARIVEAFNSVAVPAPDTMPPSGEEPDASETTPSRPDSAAIADSLGRDDAGRSAREAAVDALARLYAEDVEPEAMLSALNLAILDFPPGGAALPTDAAGFIQAAAEVIQRAPDTFVLVVAGHADRGADAAADLALSDERARAVRDALVRAGVDEDRLRAEGHGRERTRGDGRPGEGHIFFELTPREDEPEVEAGEDGTEDRPLEEVPAEPGTADPADDDATG